MLMIVKPWTITKTAQMYPTTRPNVPPTKIDSPAVIASAAMIKSQIPQPQLWVLNRPFVRSFILWLSAK